MRKRLLHAFVQQPFLLFFRFLAEHLRNGTKGSQAHQRKHDAGPHRGAAAGNALEECSGAKDNEAIKALLRAHGAVTALMTGSGAAVFGVFRDEAAARAAAAAAKRQWPQVYVAQPDRGGARVIR